MRKIDPEQFFPMVNTVFGTSLSLFRILAICNLKIKKYDEALLYFEAVKELEENNKFDAVISKIKACDGILNTGNFKNPFVHGWDITENAMNKVIMPREVSRILSSVLTAG